jgi:DNA topoisomerase-3
MFEQFGKKLTDKQILTFIEKGKSPQIKGFVSNNKKVNGTLVLQEDFTIILQEESKPETKQPKETTSSQILTCPVCGIR